MKDRDLSFETLSIRTLVQTPIFRLDESHRRGPGGREGHFVLVNSPDWANVVAIVPDEQKRPCFLMVRQFRHGLGRSVWELPGGMVDEGEDPVQAAARELEEETGWRSQKLHVLGRTNPNPSFMTNHLTVCWAEGLTPTGVMNWDDNEFLEVGLKPVHEVLSQVGSGEYDHGIMLMSLWFWQRSRFASPELAKG